MLEVRLGVSPPPRRIQDPSAGRRIHTQNGRTERGTNGTPVARRAGARGASS